MPDFRQIGNGFVNEELPDGVLDSIFKNLNLLRRDSYSNFELVIAAHVTVETIRVANLLTGKDFRSFLEVNYSSGMGPLANLVKDVAHYLNGKIGHQSLITSINVEERKLRGPSRTRPATFTPSRKAAGILPLLEDGYMVHNFDLYRLMAGISPANVGRLFQLLGGETYYV